MALTDSEKKNIMSDVENKLEVMKGEVGLNLNQMSSDEVFDKIAEMRRFLADSYNSASKYGDENLDKFFGEKSVEIDFLEKIAYKVHPGIFVKNVTNLENAIKEQYDVCLKKVDGKMVVSSDFEELSRRMVDLKYYVKNFLSDDLLKKDVVRKKVSDTSSFIKEYSVKINELKQKNRGNSNKKNIGLSDYLNNLNSSKNDIVNKFPDSKKNIESIIYFLSNGLSDKDESTIKVCLDYVKKDLLEKYGYDVESNSFNSKNEVIIDSGKKAVSNSSNNNISSSNSSSDVDRNRFVNSVGDINSYAAISNSIKLYYDDFESKQSDILNGFDSSEYEANSNDFCNCKDALAKLKNDADNRSKSYEDIEREFSELRNYISKRFNYEYKSEVKGRKRRVVSVKKLSAGVVGLASGIYGFGTLIPEIVFFSKFGFLIPDFIPFAVPVGLSILSVALLKYAVSSKEKGWIDIVIDKLRNKKDEDSLEDNHGRGR